MWWVVSVFISTIRHGTMCAVDGWSLPCRSEVDEVEFRVMQERGLISQVIIRLPACIRMCESCIVCSEARNVEYIVEMMYFCINFENDQSIQ